MSVLKYYILLFLILRFATNQKIFSQPVFEVGGSSTFELTQGQVNSHFYYNEIHPARRDFDVSVRELNLLLKVNLSEQIAIHSRGLLRQRRGYKLDEYHLSQAYMNWEKKDRSLQISMGRIINPFGRFYQTLLPRDRIFIDNPLAYSYYTNISENVGYTEGLYEPNILRIDNSRDWGLPVSYYEGYTTGIKGRWHFWPDTGFIDIAWVHAAPITARNLSNPIHPTLISRLELHPFFPWKQGFSFAMGGFMQREDINESIEDLSAYRQILVGTDFSLGYTYFELSGEIISAWHRVPVFNQDIQAFEGNQTRPDQQTLYNLSGYATLKYEMPFWVGSYLAYRVGGIYFGDIQSPTEAKRSWDDHVIRHAWVLGYHINRFTLFKSVFSVQDVSNKAWRLNTFRSSLTLYF